MDGYDTYSELLKDVEQSAKTVRTLGYAPGGNPIVAAETGGEKGPAILVMAGAHSTEHAGVCAAVDLIEELETDHQVYVIPTRDPVGLNGFDYALNLALDSDLSVETCEEAKSVLETEGEVIFEDGALLIALIGDYGFAVDDLDDGGGASILQQFKRYTETNPEVLEKLAGRRIFTAAGYDDVEAAAPFERTYTLVISPDGMPLHLNRFFTDDWAPVETRCVRRLMSEIEPGLTFDNHETSAQEDRYYIQLRPQGSPESNRQAEQIARIIASTVEERGIELATDEDVLEDQGGTVGNADEDEWPEGGFYSRSAAGSYWFDPNLTSPPRLGEGLNGPDFAGEKYGLAYTLEPGMFGSLKDRIEAAVTSVKTGVREFEKLY